MRRAVISGASLEDRLRWELLHHRQLDQEVRTAATARLDADVPAVFLDDAVGDREPEAGAGPDLLGREERVEDALLQLTRDARACVGEPDPDPVGVGGGSDPNCLPP